MVPVPSLSYARPVRHMLVHKRTDSEVFPTDLLAAGPDEMWAGVQWPSEHRFYVDPAAGVDSYLLLETIRQLTILACHQHYGVPDGAHFIMSGLGSRTVPGMSAGIRIDGHRRVVAKLTGTNIRRGPSGALQSVRMEAVFSSSDGVFAVGHGDAMIVNERVYSRIRGGRTDVVVAPARSTQPTIDPHSVGHRAAADVLLGSSPAPGTFVLSIDFANRILFDHPLDHIAGMIPVEASRQMMRLELDDGSSEFGESEFHFHNALEFGTPVLAALTRSGARMTTTFVQDGRVAVTAEFTSSERMPRRSGAEESRPGFDNR